MRTPKICRRDALVQTGLLVGCVGFGKTAASATGAEEASARKDRSSFLFCLNTATIRGQKLGIVKEVEVASKAGYDAIEPWVDSIQTYVKDGGVLQDLKRIIRDAGLKVASAIGFPEWIVDDEGRRAKGLDRAKREMELVAQIGGERFAAPPAGATDLPKLDLTQAAERYRTLLEAGEQIGVTPQLELWGFSKNLNQLGECVCVAMETGHPKACVLADVFHLYKGGSDVRGMGLLGPTAIQVLHMNDYPGEPSREKIDDSYRVYPGEGTAPIVETLRLLRGNGGQKVLSLEVFNRKYWTEDALEVAKTGLARMIAAVARL